MPYIKQEDRDKYKDFSECLSKYITIKSKGELEYLIFSCMMKYMSDKEKRYSTLHDCTYAAQHCADEFRRRFLDKREDQARDENGDIIEQENYDVIEEEKSDVTSNKETEDYILSCNHANEVPFKCSCTKDCYCKQHTCK
jgi:hypothetical protein